MVKLNKKHLPFYAALVQTAQYSLAGYFLIGWMGWFFVGLMGALVSLSMAYAASQYADIAQKRKAGSFIALVALMFMSPVLIGTATYLHLDQITNPYWRGVVSAVWGVIPDGAVVLSGFIAGKGLVEQESKPKVAGKNVKKGSKTPKVARKKMTNEALLAYLAANPGATHQQVADNFGVKRQAVGPRVKKLYEVQK